MTDISELLSEMEKAMDRYDLSKEIEKARIGEWVYGVAMVPCDWVYEYVKKQEAVEPTIGSFKAHDGLCSRWYQCGKCKMPIDHGDRFCRHCGKKVKWND